MDQKKIDEYFGDIEPLFGYNILRIRDDEELDPLIDGSVIYLHQIQCYKRLFSFITNMGASAIQNWHIPEPKRHEKYYQNIVPVLSYKILDQFQIWLEEQPKSKAELAIFVLVRELKRLKIITDENYDSGIRTKRVQEIEIADIFFRYTARGCSLEVLQKEFSTAIGGGDQLVLQHDIQINDTIILRLTETIASLDVRTLELKNEFAKIAVSEEAIIALIEDEARQQITNLLDEQKGNSIKHLIDVGQNMQTQMAEMVDTFDRNYTQEISNVERLKAEVVSHINKTLSDVEEKADLKIESVASGIVIDEALKSAFKLWDDKKDRHRTAFYIGVGLFIALILIIGSSAYEHFDPTLGYLSKIFANTNGTVADVISRIVLITIPVGITIWVLRAVLRWANLNLALAEDAAQRSVMARTYVNLLTSGDVTEDKDDRKVMLEAIFRPLPGIQEMDTAPPSIINFANPGTGK